MIEKLDPIKHTDNLFDNNGFITNVACGGVVISKINQLVDAVNEIMTWRFETDEDDDPKHREQPAENVQDKFAEQRRWIGKLCKFWDDSDEPENCVYDILCNIFDITHHEDCPFQCGNGEWYEYCEPVKPDDDIIYKGE